MSKRTLVLSFEEAEEILSKLPCFKGQNLGTYSIKALSRLLVDTLGIQLKADFGVSKIEVEEKALPVGVPIQAQKELMF